MKKLILLFAATMMASTGLRAETVTYMDVDGQEKTVDATVVTSADTPVTWGVAGTATWYVVVPGTGVELEYGAICSGAVNLILADGARLVATGRQHGAGIQVSGEGNSLTIYGQAAQSGQLYAEGSSEGAGIGGAYKQDGSNITINGGRVSAVGGQSAAGIGGGYRQHGFNITINGGEVTATGGASAAGIGGGEEGNGSSITINGGRVIANNIFEPGLETVGCGAGIGGGWKGAGSNITITNGFVTAVGYGNASGIGNGEDADSYQHKNIFAAQRCIVRAGDSENPTDVIEHDGTSDLAGKLYGKHYVTVVYDLIDAYNNGYEAGEAAGDAAGYQRAKDELPTDAEGTEGSAVVVTKGRRSVTLINPDKVSFIKVSAGK